MADILICILALLFLIFLIGEGKVEEGEGLLELLLVCMYHADCWQLSPECERSISPASFHG